MIWNYWAQWGDLDEMQGKFDRYVNKYESFDGDKNIDKDQMERYQESVDRRLYEDVG